MSIAQAESTGPKERHAAALRGASGKPTFRMRATVIAVMSLAVSAAAGVAAASASASGVSTWGSNEYGQLGDGLTSAEQLYSDVPVAVSSISEAVSVSEGCHHDLALLANGTIMAWGSNSNGQLGNSAEGGFSDVPVKVSSLEHVKEVAAGCNFSMARTESGEVYVWGEWPAGRGKSTAFNIGLTGIERIAANDGCCFGGNDGYAVASGGTVYAWGWDGQWELGYPEPIQGISVTPHPVEHLSASAVGAAAGGTFAISMTSPGGVEVWGGNHYGQHGNGRSWPGVEAPCYGSYENCAVSDERAPSSVSSVSEVTQLGAGATHALALRHSGEVLEWGAEPAFSSLSPLKVNVGGEAKALSAGAEHNIAQLASGALVDWGTNEHGSLGNGHPSGPESCPGEVGCQRAPQEVKGFSETPHLGAVSAGAALAKAPGPTLRTFTNWLSSGSLSVQKLGASMPLTGSFNGKGALHGQAGGEVSVPTQAVAAHAFSHNIPVTFGMSLTPAAWDGGPEAREYLHLDYLSLFGLTIPTFCTTKEAISITLAQPAENGTTKLEGLSGTVTIPAFRCERGFLGGPFSPILTALVSGSGNSYTLALEA